MEKDYKQFLLKPTSKMGNSCRCASPEPELQSFRTRNEYPSARSPTEQTANIILERIATGHSEDDFCLRLAHYISHCNKLEFVDHNFGYMELGDGQGEETGLSVRRMYNFQKLRLQKVYQNWDTALDICDQREVELCYLCTVFYLICRTEQLKQRIFITSFVNPHSAYILRLFCNGQPCYVVVDEKLPTLKQNPKYLSMNQPQEIWPFLLEKAWCKQIGGYDKARGLSPEDCFEEMTGIPAFSLSFGNRHGPSQIHDAIIEALKKRYWIALTAKSAIMAGIKHRQVFYLQKYNDTTQTYRLRSPYLEFQLPNRRLQPKGQIELNFNQLFGYFEFVTIGTYEPGFVSTSFSFSSAKNQENIFELTVTRPTKLNIRVIQFFAEYLSKAEQQFYKYSPVMMELYNENYNLIEKCEGMLQNLQGIRSSKISQQPLVDLQPGTYFLRVQVDWQSDRQLNSANIVIYSPKNVVKIKKCQGDVIDISGKLLGYTLEQPSIQTINGQSQDVRIRYIQKNYGYIIGIENLSEGKSQLKVIFQGSENIRINHHSLNGNQLYVELDGREERVFEVLPKDARKRYMLSSFDIVKI